MNKLPPDVASSVDGMAQLCANFYRSLRKHGVPRWAAALWTARFLEINLEVGAKLENVRVVNDPMIFPGIK